MGLDTKNEQIRFIRFTFQKNKFKKIKKQIFTKSLFQKSSDNQNKKMSLSLDANKFSNFKKNPSMPL